MLEIQFQVNIWISIEYPRLNNVFPCWISILHGPNKQRTCRFASIWQQKNNRALKYSTWIVCPGHPVMMIYMICATSGWEVVTQGKVIATGGYMSVYVSDVIPSLQYEELVAPHVFVEFRSLGGILRYFEIVGPWENVSDQFLFLSGSFHWPQRVGGIWYCNSWLTAHG